MNYYTPAYPWGRPKANPRGYESLRDIYEQQGKQAKAVFTGVASLMGTEYDIYSANSDAALLKGLLSVTVTRSK